MSCPANRGVSAELTPTTALNYAPPMHRSPHRGLTLARRAWIWVWCAGCGLGQSSLQQPTAKAIGCAPDDVLIAQDVGGFGGRTWIAHCNGQRYECASRQNAPAPECVLSQ